MYEKFLIDPWPWWFGGIYIGLLVPVMYYFLNTPLGVSTSYGNLAKIVFPKTKLKWLNSEKFQDVFNWRFFFIAGMIIGGFISARTGGKTLLTLDMGLLTKTVPWNAAVLAIWFFGGGLLLALGARLANGCTSGHSIHGIANLHFSSILATIFFLLFGVIGVRLVKLFVLGGL